MTDPQDKDGNDVVLDASNDPIVTLAVLPQFTEPRSLQGLTDTAWIFQGGNPFMEELQYPPRNLMIQFI